MTKKEVDMLYKVIERHFDYKKSLKSENPTILQFAEKLLDINTWEIWALTQKN